MSLARHGITSSTARLAAAFLSVIILYVLATAPSARADIYKLYSCNVPGRSTPVPSAAPWKANLDGLHTFYYDDCRSGGSFGIGLNIQAMRANSAASLALVRPDAGAKSVIGIVRYRTWVTAELSGSGAPAFVDDGASFSPPGGTTPDNVPWVSPLFPPTNPGVYVRLRCTAGDCSFNSRTPLQARGIEVDLYEDVPPSGVIEGGTLLGAGTRTGRSTLSFSATDQESGVARVEALLGDTVVAGEDLERNGALCPHTDWNACPARYSADFVIDSSTVPPGAYPLALRITDAAGNRRLITAGAPISIGKEEAPVAKTRLTASFGRTRTSYTTDFKRSVRLRGRLTDPSGNPIAHARIAITERPSMTDRGTREAYTMTDSDGRFSQVISGNGPSRSIELRYFSGVGDAIPSASGRLQLRVRAASTFKLSLHGVIVRYAGRVLTRPLPRGGKKVFIQGRARGDAWRRFAVRRTDKAGRYSGRYRLRVRRPGVKLQFRVELPKQSGYPFARRTGPVVTRVVR
jgi:hypothetical protein